MKKRIKKMLIDMRKQCEKFDYCVGCPYQEICYPCLPYLWNDEEIENMAAGWYELLNKEKNR